MGYLQKLIPTSGLIYNSIVFEPNKMLMYLRFKENDVAVQLCRSAVLNVAELLVGAMTVF